MLPMKRERSSLDSDSHPGEEVSTVKRRSPRKPVRSPVREQHLIGHLNKENCPSPQKSPRRPAVLPANSPYKASPFTLAVGSGSFYGKQKAVYLTPLERKKVKEALPCPPLRPSPPSEVKKTAKIAKKKNVKGCNKTKKKSPGPSDNVKNGMKHYATSSNAVKLITLSNSFTAKLVPTTTVPPVSSKTPEAKKTIPFSLKAKPKIFVGAAFFGTNKKPTSMYKKSAPKSSTRPVPKKNKTVPPPTQTEKPKQQPAPKMNKPQEISPQQKEAESSSKPRTRFDPLDWIDSVDDVFNVPTPELPSSPKERCGINKELAVVLTRTPELESRALSFMYLGDECVADGNMEPVFDLSDISPTKGVYPIFGTASKKSKITALQPPGSCSTSSGRVSTPQAHGSATKERTLRKRKEKQDDDQLIIDAGQKQFGVTICSSCGMVYSVDNPEDNFQHTQFHQRFVDAIKYMGWKKERVVAQFWDGKILLVMPDDPKYAIKKAEEVRQVADSELGFQQVTLSRPAQAKTYLFINTEGIVVGCIVAETIRQAYRVLEQPDRAKDMTKDDFMERHRAWCCSTVPEPALCGISRIWVFSLARRKGIATRMLDTVRSTFMYGSHLTKEEIAFSDPTPDGKLFATKYSNTPTFLVYNFLA